MDVNTALALMQQLGINPLVILVVIFLTGLCKAIDRRNKLKAGYVLFPLVSSLIATALVPPFVPLTWAFASLVHAACGAYFYDLYANAKRAKKKA